MEEAIKPKLVKALHAFKGTNNDELCFNKDDILTITQVLDGGWWEGSKGEKIGWFPSNYVTELDTSILPNGKVHSNSEDISTYHSLVLQTLIESEKNFIMSIQNILQVYLNPLRSSNVLSLSECAVLHSNLDEILSLHQTILNCLEDSSKVSIEKVAIGGIFLRSAAQLKHLYQSYCSNHPRAVLILQEKRSVIDKFLEEVRNDAAMFLISSLSQPFTRLEKYPSTFKELERHTSADHMDRGDTQRVISVYKDISICCKEIRRQKEIELDILVSPIKHWEGEEISSMGEIVLLSQVQVSKSDSAEKLDRIFILFPLNLVMLSYSSRLSGYTFQGKLPVAGMRAQAIDDPESFLFEMSGSFIEKRQVACKTAAERDAWIKSIECHSSPTNKSSLSLPEPSQSFSPQIQNPAPVVSVLSHARLELVSPNSSKNDASWKMSCLRPCPPVRPLLKREDSCKSPRASHKVLNKRKPDEYRGHDDSCILRVIEAYCTSTRSRHTVNSYILDSQQKYLVEDENMNQQIRARSSSLKERSTEDSIYFIKSQLQELKQNYKKIRKDLEEETKARRKLEVIVDGLK